MLHDFIVENRERIIERVRRALRERAAPKSIATTLEHGVPLFLTQLADALASADSARDLQRVSSTRGSTTIGDSAALNGHDLLRSGFTVAQVVHGYGDVFQVVTELAGETHVEIGTHDLQVFNRCLDDAIAGAVTAFGLAREQNLAYEGTERLGILAHELRNLLHTAILSFDLIKKGRVGASGSTGAVHARSLSGISALVERSLAEVRLRGVPMLERVSMLEFMEEFEIAAKMQASGYGLQLTVHSLGSDVAIDVDRQLLASALSNLLQNAFKFTRAESEVSLSVRTTNDRVLIEVGDQCGGLPPGKAEELFRPFTRKSSDRSGLGLGLSIARSAARANSGDLYVRDVPGVGCVFTIDLPRTRGPGEPGCPGLSDRE